MLSRSTLSYRLLRPMWIIPHAHTALIEKKQFFLRLSRQIEGNFLSYMALVTFETAYPTSNSNYDCCSFRKYPHASSSWLDFAAELNSVFLECKSFSLYDAKSSQVS